MTWLLSQLLSILSSGMVDKAVAYLERKAALEADEAKVRATVTIETIRAAVEDTRIMAGLESRKLDSWLFWVFLSVFVLPLGFWWTAVILDSVFLFEWDVAALPRPLDEWAGRIIGWLFFAGGAAALIARGR